MPTIVDEGVLVNVIMEKIRLDVKTAVLKKIEEDITPIVDAVVKEINIEQLEKIAKLDGICSELKLDIRVKSTPMNETPTP